MLQKLQRSAGIAGALEGAPVARLSGPATPELSFDMANLAPPSSATKKQRSAVDLVKKAEKQKERDLRKAKQEAKERARVEEKKADKLRAKKKKVLFCAFVAILELQNVFSSNFVSKTNTGGS